MPNAGDIEYAYSRQYRFIKPSGGDPGTWRLATPAYAIAGGGGGGTGGATYDFDGVDPIVVNTLPPVGVGPTIVKTSLDIQKLNDRAI